MTCWLQESLMMYWNERGDLLSIDARELAEFRQWRELKWRAPGLNELVKEFLKSKREDRNLHSGYVKTLEYNLYQASTRIRARAKTCGMRFAQRFDLRATAAICRKELLRRKS